MNKKEKREMYDKDLEENGMLVIKRKEQRQFIVYPDRKEEIFPGHPRWDDTLGW
ncbi:MAG: hypothetical protein ACLFRG_22190 [Desulfococcaceae bacterium]